MSSEQEEPLDWALSRGEEVVPAAPGDADSRQERRGLVRSKHEEAEHVRGVCGERPWGEEWGSSEQP